MESIVTETVLARPVSHQPFQRDADVFERLASGDYVPVSTSKAFLRAFESKEPGIILPGHLDVIRQFFTNYSGEKPLVFIADAFYRPAFRRPKCSYAEFLVGSSRIGDNHIVYHESVQDLFTNTTPSQLNVVRSAISRVKAKFAGEKLRDDCAAETSDWPKLSIGRCQEIFLILLISSALWLFVALPVEKLCYNFVHNNRA